MRFCELKIVKIMLFENAFFKSCGLKIKNVFKLQV
jgi:hypothetical protein